MVSRVGRAQLLFVVSFRYVRFGMRDAIWLARSYLPADHFSLTKPTVICSVRSRHFSLSYDLHTLHPLPSERLRPYALGKESGIPHTRQGLPAGPEVSRKGPDRVKRRQARASPNPLLLALSSRPRLPPYLPFVASSAWTAQTQRVASSSKSPRGLKPFQRYSEVSG